MSEYKGIKGFQVQTREQDPSEGIPGDFYYNSSTGQFKTIKTGVGSWSSGGSVNTARAYGGSSGTSRDAAMYFGGYTIPTNYANTEQYNGSSWTEVADLSNSRTSIGGFGNSLTAAVAVGGDEFPAPSPRYLADVEEWDGTNWTSGGALNTGKAFGRISCGIQTAALVAGAPGYSATTEQYNGSSWTEVADLNTAGSQGGGGGTYTSAITSGNVNTASVNAESWDGTSWTEVGNRSTDAYAVGGAGSSNANAIVFAGYDSSPAGFPTATEEWDLPDFEIKTVTTS